MPGAVFVFELDSGDIEVYPDEESASRGIEHYDVGITAAVAETGMSFRLVVDEPHVRLLPTNEVDRASLEQQLVRHCEDRSIPFDTSAPDRVVAVANALAAVRWSVRAFRWWPWLDRRFNGSGPATYD